MNDNVANISIPKGFHVVLYDNAGFCCTPETMNGPYDGKLSERMQEDISSLIVTRSVRRLATLQEVKDYKGQGLTINADMYVSPWTPVYRSYLLENTYSKESEGADTEIRQFDWVAIKDTNDDCPS